MSMRIDRQAAEQILADAPVLRRAVSKPGSTPAIGRTSKATAASPVSTSDRLAIAQHAREPGLHARRRFGDVLQVERAAERVVEAAVRG